LVVPVLLKKCPSCGKTFEVSWTDERVVSREKEMVFVEEPTGSMSPDVATNTFAAGPLPDVTLSTQPQIEPVAAERDVIEESYTCKHCGHTWVETREVFRKADGGEVEGRIVGEGAP